MIHIMLSVGRLGKRCISGHNFATRLIVFIIMEFYPNDPYGIAGSLCGFSV